MDKRIILVGAAASGKDFFRDYLGRIGKTLDVSYTSRAPREGEKDGYTYHYISDKDFVQMRENKEFYEHVNFNGWLYGTSMKNWKNSDVFIMTPSGLKHVSDKDRKNCVVVFFDIDENVRKERLSKRSDADKTERRLQADKIDFIDFQDFDIRITKPNFEPFKLIKTIDFYKTI